MNSFRTQMLLVVCGSVVAAMLVLGIAIITINTRQLQSGLDHELVERANGMARPGPPPPPPGGPMRMPEDEPDLIASIRRPRMIMADALFGTMPMPGDLFDEAAVRLAANGSPSFSDCEYRGEPVRVYTAPIVRGRMLAGVVQVAHETRGIADVREVQFRTLMIVLPFVLIGSVLLGFAVTGRVMHPIGAMQNAAKAIADGDFGARIQTRGSDEFAKLGEQFNAMAGRVEEAVSGLRQSLEQQRRFTADASHELRTPLTRLQLAASAAQTGSEEEMRRALKTAEDTGKEMAALVSQLLTLASADAGRMEMRFETFDLRVAAAEAVSKTMGGETCETAFASDAVTVLGDEAQMERVCTNLLENARKYAKGARISVRVFRENGFGVLQVQDEGIGIEARHLPHLVERFYRVEDARTRDAGGAGLGLAIVDEIVKAHRGELRIESEPGKGTCVTVRVPAVK